MNGYAAPLGIGLIAVVGGAIADNAEPVLTFIGGGGAVGAAFANAFEMRSATPDYGRATAAGTVTGAILGAALLLLDAVIGS